jgi:twitching motility protein PilT
MVTFDEYIVDLYKHGFITEDTAKAFASNRGAVGRGIDAVKSGRGETTTGILGKLEVDKEYGRFKKRR